MLGMEEKSSWVLEAYLFFGFVQFHTLEVFSTHAEVQPHQFWRCMARTPPPREPSHGPGLSDGFEADSLRIGRVLPVLGPWINWAAVSQASGSLGLLQFFFVWW